jgi:hypothetical protein
MDNIAFFRRFLKKCMIIVLLNNGIQFIPKVVQIGVGWKKNDE